MVVLTPHGWTPGMQLPLAHPDAFKHQDGDELGITERLDRDWLRRRRAQAPLSGRRRARSWRAERS